MSGTFTQRYILFKVCRAGLLNPNVEIMLERYTNAALISYVLNKTLVCSRGTVAGCSNIVSSRLLTALKAQLQHHKIRVLSLVVMVQRLAAEQQHFCTD